MATKARDHIKELAIETMDLREEMRELANLKGAGGPDNDIAASTVDMAMKAGLLPQQMVKYLEQFEGSVPAGEQKGHIDPKTKQELALEGAKFGARVSLAPQTAGDLAGVIAQYTDLTKDGQGNAIPQDQRTARAMNQMGRFEYGLNMGRGKLETLTRSLINTAGAVVGMGGPIEDLGDLAAIQGVASTHANPKESGTRVRQAVRALRDTKGDVGMFLTKNAGIKDGDSHIERLEIAQVTGMGRSMVFRAIGPAGPAVEPPSPDEEPSGIGPPGARQAPAFVEVSARLIARLRRDYGRGVLTDEGRAIGDIPEVADWLEGLEPGKVPPEGPRPG